MAEISSTSLWCNSCWRELTSGNSYKTSCLHLFCEACAHKSFANQSLICPLCDAGLNGDGGVILITPDRSAATAIKVFAFAAFHCDDAMRLVHDGVSFARGQTALLGTRELWVKEREIDGMKRRIIEADNRINTLMGELQLKSTEAEELAVRLATKNKDAAEQRQKRKEVEGEYLKLSGGRPCPTQMSSSSNPSSTAASASLQLNTGGGAPFQRRIGSSGSSVGSDGSGGDRGGGGGGGGQGKQQQYTWPHLQQQQQQNQQGGGSRGGGGGSSGSGSGGGVGGGGGSITAGGTSVVMLPTQTLSQLKSGAGANSSITRPITPYGEPFTTGPSKGGGIGRTSLGGGGSRQR